MWRDRPAVVSSALAYVIALSVGFVLSKHFLPYTQFVVWNTHAYFKHTHQEHPIGGNQWLPVFIKSTGAYEMVGKSRLVKYWTKTRTISSASDNVKTHELPRVTSTYGGGLSLHVVGGCTDIQFLYNRLVYWEEVKEPHLVNL